NNLEELSEVTSSSFSPISSFKDNSEDSDTQIETSKTNSDSGSHHPSEIYNYINKSEQKSKGHYAAKCKCGKY
ncbi:7345_t:CDS:2, partial [Cetraspora pellucida]